MDNIYKRTVGRSYSISFKDFVFQYFNDSKFQSDVNQFSIHFDGLTPDEYNDHNDDSDIYETELSENEDHILEI